ncbi:hypothetical protein GO730_12620 [Spirosoma sp. HMF3257]|uniref:Uncharacterized protein n=1 Tax=Spirosoma telluris TaxID=2183553 RepID=A0A327NLA7_9BACT|nr:hypothetical protein [Spirosoma telluris]RAI74856.1 hypothetical protein HMF3257_12530 [Spirosoma telluris]
MTTLLNHQSPADAERISSRIGRAETDTIQNQSAEPFANEDDDIDDETTENEEIDDEPVDEDGDPTGEHDHHQDDNYALGGHVTRSGA